MTAAAIAVPNTFAFSDAAVFGRVSDKVNAYLDRFVDEAPVAPTMPGLFDMIVRRVDVFFANLVANRELNTLSDRMLADMGMTRADVDALAL